MMRVSDVAAAIQGQSIGHDAGFLRVSIDSRTLAEGDLFIAIRGDRFDGHDFVEYPVHVTDKDLDEDAWQGALQNAEMYGYYPTSWDDTLVDLIKDRMRLTR